MWVCRLPVHIGPRSVHRFYDNLRRICSFPMGRCRHRPYIKTGRCIRMRPSFSQNQCILRADRVVRPYADFSFVKQSTTKRTRLQCGKSAQYLLFGEFMLQ